MPIVYTCAASHAPGLTAWADAAPAEQKAKLYSAFETIRDELQAARPDVILLLTSEHWANFFEHVGAFCIGRGETFEGPVEPWLKVPKTDVKGDPKLSEALLERAYASGFELSFSHEMRLDHGSMVPLHFLTPEMQTKIVPLMFNTLAAPRATPARCVGLGEALRPVLEAWPERIAIVATGGLSHDPGERGHGFIDTDFDATFIDRLTRADLPALASYRDAEIMAAGAGTAELLAWLCMAGIMGQTQPRLVAYEAVKPWATGIGIVSYSKAA
jgi:2,3-dihydroxyphenylpropionate 1,2-dioxygenase